MTPGDTDKLAPAEPISVYVTDDDAQFSRFVAELLKLQPGFAVAGVAPSLEVALTELAKIEADVLVLDIYMGGGETLEGIPDLKQLRPRMKILVLTGGGWEDQQVASLVAGAHGFLYKPFTSSDLVRAIRLVHEGKAFFDSAALTEALMPAPVSPSDVPALSEEEEAFLGLLRTGASNAAIAAALNVTIKAVYQRRFRLKSKLGLRSSRDLIRFAKGAPVEHPSHEISATPAT